MVYEVPATMLMGAGNVMRSERGAVPEGTIVSPRMTPLGTPPGAVRIDTRSGSVPDPTTSTLTPASVPFLPAVNVCPTNRDQWLMPITATLGEAVLDWSTTTVGGVLVGVDVGVVVLLGVTASPQSMGALARVSPCA